MITEQLTEAPSLFTQIRELWLDALGRAQRCRDLETTRAALEHLDNHMRRDIGLGPKERMLLARADIILQIHR